MFFKPGCTSKSPVVLYKNTDDQTSSLEICIEQAFLETFSTIVFNGVALNMP